MILKFFLVFVKFHSFTRNTNFKPNIVLKKFQIFFQTPNIVFSKIMEALSLDEHEGISMHGQTRSLFLTVETNISDNANIVGSVY